MTERRYDIDWVRVIAIGLLLVYHVAIGFQSWGIMIAFITTSKPWQSLWAPMAMLNVWRIPLLFFVSGMGVFFAISRRNCKELLLERGGRILVPFVFGIIVLVPIHLFIWQYYYDWKLQYSPNPGHLWFLGNIFSYVVILLPLFMYLKKNANSKIVNALRCTFGSPLGLLLVMTVCTAEALIVNPKPFELYAMTWHGFWLGLIAFLFGFCFALAGTPFWKMIVRWRWMFISIAIVLFTVRMTFFQPFAPGYFSSIESNFWVFSVFAFASRYLNRPSSALEYLSKAAYPVYILHMIFLYLGSLIFFPLQIPHPLQFVLVLMFTLAGCLSVYEVVIRRSRFLRPLFGLTSEAEIKNSPQAA